ncbi:tyrosine-type recombinase/integrase [Intestinimonas butyriciproducens]|uniref:tyrosine-type recombinase/integrase n=1 Tax=Intestinimonas butyriciproducens TaxID=1297617 RepID=UPI00195BC36E|nr:site-specific integrase [Intestinimonas butyriciproducens]MBM6976422.1 site-specific integrase [Intestinimonas butyriciproducens]
MPRKSKTRGAQGAGTIRQRKDGRWEARYTVGRDPGTGKQIQRSVYGATQQEVRKKLAQLTTALDNGTYKEPCKMTVGQWLDIWTADYMGGVKPSTAFLYGEQIRLYIKPALGAVKLEALNTHTIQGFYNGLSIEREGGKALSPKSVKNIHGILHKALQQAVAVGYIRFNPADACTLPRAEKKEISPLDEEQIVTFLKAIEGHRHELLYKVALFTGMREGEVLGLMWDCVDFEKGTITIKRQLRREQKKGGAYYITTPKNGKPRTITPAPWVMKLLRSQKARQAEQQLKMGQLWENSGMVFTNETGGYLSYRTVYDCFKRIVAQMGTPSTRFHDLRHTFAVASLRAGDDIKTVQGNLGHHTAAFTLDVYGHVTEQMKKDSAQRMEGFIKGVLNL